MAELIMFPKPKQVKNPALLTMVSKMPCTIGSQECKHYMVHAHHVTCKGSGRLGWGDIGINVMPLCAKHHNEWHSSSGGTYTMLKRYIQIEAWLETHERWDILHNAKRY